MICYPRKMTAVVSVERIEQLISDDILYPLMSIRPGERITNLKFGSKLFTGSAETIPVEFDIEFIKEEHAAPKPREGSEVGSVADTEEATSRPQPSAP